MWGSDRTFMNSNAENREIRDGISQSPEALVPGGAWQALMLCVTLCCRTLKVWKILNIFHTLKIKILEPLPYLKKYSYQLPT